MKPDITSKKRIAALAGAAALAAVITVTAPAPAHAYVAGGGWEDSNVPQTIQDTSENCVPASFSMQLASVGASAGYTQDYLATQMQTNEAPGGGTTWPNAQAALNKIANPDWTYTTRPLENGTELMAEVHYEISRFGSAVVAPVNDIDLPWHKTTTNYGHDVVIYGVNTGASDVAVMDPNNDGSGGIHVVSAQTMWAALQGADTSTMHPTNVGTLHVIYEFSQDQ